MLVSSTAMAATNVLSTITTGGLEPQPVTGHLNIAIPLLVAGSATGAAAFAGAASPPREAGNSMLLVALLIAVTGEIVGRYLFFVSVVPKHLAAPYIASASEAT